MTEANQIEENRDELQQSQLWKNSFSRSAPDNIVIINNLTIINGGLDIVNEGLRRYAEFMENALKFNMNAIRMMTWNNPFLNPAQLKLVNKE
jgi:hypothetical protein